MRDLLILGLLVVLVVMALKRPVIGALGWVLFSVMNPHRLAYGFALNFPFALILAAVTVVGLLARPKQAELKGGLAPLLLVVLFAWCSITTLNAFNPVQALDYLERVSKTFAMTLVIMLLVNSRRDVVALVSVLAFSLAFYGSKGGLFVLATGGKYMVNGPPGTVMDGNNALGVGLTMCIPMLYFLREQTHHKWLRLGLMAAMVSTSLSVLGTYSRGALLAVAAMLVLLWWRSRSKVMLGIMLAGFVVVAIPFMPDSWTERMNTIKSHEEDESAMGRLYAWQTATNIAKDRFPLAGGFEWHGKETSAKYSPAPEVVFVAHSIYFQVLGSQGFIGLAIWLWFWVLVMLQCQWLRTHARGREDLRWAQQLGSLMQVSLLGYAVGGAFLDLAFWDLPYYLFAAIAGAKHVVKRELSKPADPSASAGPSPSTGSPRTLPPTAVTSS